MLSIHLDPDAPAPVALYPDAGVLLVHQCETEAARAVCEVCPLTTCLSAPVLALHALAEAELGDPDEWPSIADQVATLLEAQGWESIVAGWSAEARDLADEDTTALPRVLVAAGGGVPAPLVPPAALPPVQDGWQAQPLHETSPDLALALAPPALALAPGAEPAAVSLAPAQPRRRRVSWSTWALTGALLAATAVIGLAAGPTVVRVIVPSTDTPAEQRERQDGPGLPVPREAGNAEPASTVRPSATAPAPAPTPTPAPPSPTSSPDSRQVGNVGGRTAVAPPPAPASSASSTSAPPVGGGQDPPVEPAPEPSQSSSSAPAPGGGEAGPTCVLDALGVCIAGTDGGAGDTAGG